MTVLKSLTLFICLITATKTANVKAVPTRKAADGKTLPTTTPTRAIWKSNNTVPYDITEDCDDNESSLMRKSTEDREKNTCGLMLNNGEGCYSNLGQKGDYLPARHYTLRAYGINNTITRECNYQGKIDQHDSLSFEDVKGVNWMYSCNSNNTKTPVCPKDPYLDGGCRANPVTPSSSSTNNRNDEKAGEKYQAMNVRIVFKALGALFGFLTACIMFAFY